MRVYQIKMEITHIFAVTALFVGVAESFFDPSVPGNGILNMHRVMSMLADSSKGFYDSMANRGAMDQHHYQGTRNRAADDGSEYKGRASQFGHLNHRASLSGYGSNKNLDMHGNMNHNAIKDINRLSNGLGHRSSARNVHNKQDENSANGYNNGVAGKKAFQTGKVFDDNVVYSFDKEYDQNMTEKGGFEDEEGRNAHRLHAFTDKKNAGKHIKGSHSAQNARRDSQNAQRESNYRDGAAQRQRLDSSYGSNDKKQDKAGATQDAQDVLYDRNDDKHYAENRGDKTISRDTKNFANKNKRFHRDAAASQAGKQRHGDKKYQNENDGSLGQLGAAASRAGTRGHADKLYQGRHANDGRQGNHDTHGYDGAGPVRRSRTHSDVGQGTGTHGDENGGRVHHKSKENRLQSEQDKQHLGKIIGASDVGVKSYKQAKNKGDFASVKGLHDQREGKFAQAVHNAQNDGFNNQQIHSGKTAKGEDRKSAKADAGSRSKASVHDLDDNAFNKGLYQKNQQDNRENYKKRKTFYHDKNQDGKNYERLNYNRKRKENEYAESQAAKKQHGNQFSKDQKTSGHSAANRKDNFLNAQKASNNFGRLNANRQSGGHSDNRGSKFDKRNQHSLAENKNIAESDFTKDRDAHAKNRGDHYDNSYGTAAKSFGGFQNKLSQKGRYDKRSNGNGGILDRSRLTRPGFGRGDSFSFGTPAFRPINFNQNTFHSMGPVDSYGSFDQRRKNAGRSGPRKAQVTNNGNSYVPSGSRRIQAPHTGNRYLPSRPRSLGGNRGDGSSYGGADFGTNPFGDFNGGRKSQFSAFDDVWRSSSGFASTGFGTSPFGKSSSFGGSDSGFGYQH